MEYFLNLFSPNSVKLVENNSNNDGPGVSYQPLRKPGVIETKTIEYLYNEITEINFTMQTQILNPKIITLKPDCYIENRGWFSNTRYKIGENFNLIAHQELYNYLYKKNIIVSKIFTLANLFAGTGIYVINKDLITEDPAITENTLKTIINQSNSDFPQLLTCYEMNYAALSDYLINYKYSPINEIPIGYPMGGRKKQRNKTRRKNKTKHKTKKYQLRG
jgi:hypothetical protein